MTAKVFLGESGKASGLWSHTTMHRATVHSAASHLRQNKAWQCRSQRWNFLVSVGMLRTMGQGGSMTKTSEEPTLGKISFHEEEVSNRPRDEKTLTREKNWVDTKSV